MTYGPWQISNTVRTERKNLFCMHYGSEHHIGTIISGSRESLERFENSLSLIRKAPDLREHLERFVMIMISSNEINETELRDVAFQAAKTLAEIKDIFREG